ncbi:unnamed protein product [Rotaria sordida]|uniref:Uncharacterized protein n=1 Tax=Rotaria sordida TaxID=392033 RepID=A0A815KME8_9BILA|nr:unnamed protein product [Rotaria sordida]
MLLLNVDMRFQGAMHEREPYEEANLNLISTLSVKQSQFRYQRRPAKDDFMIIFFDCQSLEMFGINQSILIEHNLIKKRKLFTFGI